MKKAGPGDVTFTASKINIKSGDSMIVDISENAKSKDLLVSELWYELGIRLTVIQIV